MTTKRILIPLVATALVISAAHARELVSDQFGFRITIPDEFQDFPPLKDRPVVLYSFLRPSPAGEKNVSIVIERMNGTIGQEPMPAEVLESIRATLPPGSSAGICRREWKGYTVEGIECNMPYGEIRAITRSVQIPLLPGAIQINVAGPETADEEISQVLGQLLISLQGDSNWDLRPGRKLTTEERMVSGFKGVFWIAVTIALAIVIAKAITKTFRRKKAS